MARSAQEVIDLLGLEPHPEGGWYRQTFRDGAQVDGRAVSTAIYYLLAQGERSHWHRIDAAEIWHFYAGAPLGIALSPDDGTPPETHVLGPGLDNGERPQVIVPAQWWQSAVSMGAWTLVGCTVAPGFDFGGFELAAKDFVPG